MKKHFTNFIYTMLVVLVGTSGLFAQSSPYIWGGPGDKNSEFDGGLNDWTVNAITNDSAIWVWEADGKADRGAYSGKEDAVQIQSPSVANGAMVFDADYYDNAGIEGNIGKGPAPGRQKADLISPVFSCENDSTVYLVFHQYFRTIYSVCKLQISVDGGETYPENAQIDLNKDVDVNGSVFSNSKVIVDISKFAANKSQVRIKFNISAFYYLWIIDDVYVMRELPAEPAIIGAWYPSKKYQTPVDQVSVDSFYFAMDVKNLGNKEVTALKGSVSLVNLDDEIVYYEDSVENILDQPLRGGDTLKGFSFRSWKPTDMTPGVYRVLYRILPTEDTTIAPNSGWVYRLTFKLTENKFVAIDGTDTTYTNAIKFNDDGESIFARAFNSVDGVIFYINRFKMSNWVNNKRVKIAVDTVNYSMTQDRGSGVKYTYDSKVYLLKLADTIDDQLSNFDDTDGIYVDGTQSKQLTLVGYSTQKVNDVTDYENTHVGLISDDSEGEEVGYVPLEPNGKYFLAMKWDSDKTTFQDIDVSSSFGSCPKYYYPVNRTSMYYGNFQVDDAGTIQHLFGFTGSFSWVMGMNLIIVHSEDVATKEELLPDNSVTFLGNPTKENLNVAISLEQTAEKASMVVSDINGKVIDMRTVYNLKDSNERFYVGNLPNGTYMFTLFTKDKLLTKKFVVAK